MIVCKDCQFRTQDCHGKCEKYKAEVEDRIAKKRYLREQRGVAATDVLARGMERRKKRYG